MTFSKLFKAKDVAVGDNKYERSVLTQIGRSQTLIIVYCHILYMCNSRRHLFAALLRFKEAFLGTLYAVRGQIGRMNFA